MAQIEIPDGALKTRAGIPSVKQGIAKAKITGRLLAAFILAFWIVANLPFTYVEAEPIWMGQLELSESEQGGTADMPVMGGWPFRYSIAYLEGQQLDYRLWKPSILGFNIILGCFSCWFICWFLSFRFRSLLAVSESHPRRLWFDSFFAFCILAIPLTFLGTKVWEPYQQQKLIRKHLSKGNVCISTWLPAWVDPHVPVSIKPWLSQVRHVRLTASNPEMFGELAKIPTLVSLHSYGGDYGGVVFDELGKGLHFNSLLIANAELSDRHFDSISKMRWLKHLKFPGTALTSDQFHLFDNMPLVTVDVRGTGLAFSELQNPNWSKTCELLWLSRPPNGKSSSLNLRQWSSLKSLWVKRRSYVLNDAVLGIRLEDLPQLRRLCLDRAQKHDLSLSNVPRLARIEEETADSRVVTNDRYLAPGLTWVRNLKVDGADSLTELGCYAKDLEQLDLGELPNLKKFKMGSFMITLLGNVVPQESDLEKSERWIHYLGQRSGPYELDLEHLPLHGVRLSPLAGNREIHQLNLNGTYVDFAQLKQLGLASKCKSLDARTTMLSGHQFLELMELFPQVEHLLVDGANLKRLDTLHSERLKFLSVSTMRNVEEVSLVDQPDMNTVIQMVAKPNRLEIENVPGLRGLSLEGPWPSSSSLHGLRDLEWFAGGGAEVNDQLAEEILACAHLHHLVFAYPSVSREALEDIGELKELISLSLPGSVVDDEVIRNWNHVNDLWEANFNDTSIGAEAIHWLASMSSLRRLSLNRIDMNRESMEAVVSLRQICELHLDGTRLPAEVLSKLLRHGHLEVLNLTGWDFDEALMKVLETDAKTLEHLKVHNSDLSYETFSRLMNLSDSIYIDMFQYPAQTSDAEIVAMHDRADALRRKYNSGWRLMLESPQDVGGRMSQNQFWREREKRLAQRRTPWMPPCFSLELGPEKFSHSSLHTFSR